MRNLSLILVTFLFFHCKQKDSKSTLNNTEVKQTTTASTLPKKVSKADSIINKAIESHGGELYKKANYSFIFREKKYTFKNDNANYFYSVETNTNDSLKIVDKTENGNFERSINGKHIKLSQKEIDNFSNSLNSVIYFTTLPYKLNDQSVNKEYIGETFIKKQEYHIIKVTFNKEGGGKDYDDQYYYWINKTGNTVDYFAYNYKVNGGGVRFRSFYNRKNIDGIIFQDYINWKAENKTPLDSLPILFENNKLIKASIIENTQIHNLKTKK